MTLLHDADWLRRRYAIDGQTMAEIAAEVGCGRATVGDWMLRHGMRRSASAT
jgi:hypothetical protein